MRLLCFLFSLVALFRRSGRGNLRERTFNWKFKGLVLILRVENDWIKKMFEILKTTTLFVSTY